MLLENSNCKMIEPDCKQRLSADVSFHYTMHLRSRVPLLITLVAMTTSAQKHSEGFEHMPRRAYPRPLMPLYFRQGDRALVL